MTDHSEHPSEGAAAPSGPTGPAGDAFPPAEGPPPPPKPRDGRFRRWSSGAPARMGAVALAAGLIGGLVGGGIVALFSGDGHDDRSMPVRFERGMPRGGQGFGGPRFYDPRGQWGRPYPRLPFQPPKPQPTAPVTPAPPTPKATG